MSVIEKGPATRWPAGPASESPSGSADQFSADQFSADQFRTAFRHHAAGVAVITAEAGEGPVGFTATSVFSVSVAPPLLVFSISDQTSSAPTIRRADTVVVHLLAPAQLPIAELCATSGTDRFADDGLWDRLPTGEPYFPSAQSWIHGRVIERMSAGSSTVVAVRALGVKTPVEPASSEPLVYHNRSWHSLGEHSRLAR